MIEFLSPLSVDYEATRGRIKAVAEDVAAIRRSIPDANARTSGLDWTLGETSAHLCTTIRLYIDCLEGRVVPESRLVPDVPSFVQQQNEVRLQTFGERRPALLADLLLGEVDALVTILEGRSSHDLVPFPAGYQIDAAVQSSIALVELLIHGLDLARSTGKAWHIAAEDAVLAIAGPIALMPVAANRQRAKRVRGTVHTRLRGDGCYAVHMSEGNVRTHACSGRADLYVSADPVALLLTGYGRISPFAAALTGKIFAWGRKPWLGLAFAWMFRTG